MRRAAQHRDHKAHDEAEKDGTVVISDEGFNVLSVDFGQKTQAASISRTSTRLFANVTIGDRTPYSRPTSCPVAFERSCKFSY